MPSTALITGASAGIGAEFARQLAPLSRALVLVARRSDRLEQLKADLCARHPQLAVTCIEADLSTDRGVEAVIERVRADGIRVDMLVNNAGLGDHGDFATADWERIRAMLAVNIGALTRLTHALLPDLLEQPRAAIINVGSIAGYLPLPRLAVYAATKAYVNSLSEALRAELRGTGVGVTALCPGPVKTEFGGVARRPDAAEGMPAPAVVTVPVEQVVREGLEAAARDSARVIPGLLLSVAMEIAACIPLAILRPFLSCRARKPAR